MALHDYYTKQNFFFTILEFLLQSAVSLSRRSNQRDKKQT